MNFELLPITQKDLPQFKKDMQDAFQKVVEDSLGATNEIILPERHIDHSLKKVGASAYKAVIDSNIVGGAVVIINKQTQRNFLELLYVKNGTQSKGVGLAIWNEIERLFPDTKVWETITPYFEKRNIHFYINRCGFHAVEFFNKHHPDTIYSKDLGDDKTSEIFIGADEFFKFEKVMKHAD